MFLAKNGDLGSIIFGFLVFWPKMVIWGVTFWVVSVIGQNWGCRGYNIWIFGFLAKDGDLGGTVE